MQAPVPAPSLPVSRATTPHIALSGGAAPLHAEAWRSVAEALEACAGPLAVADCDAAPCVVGFPATGGSSQCAEDLVGVRVETETVSVECPDGTVEDAFVVALWPEEVPVPRDLSEAMDEHTDLVIRLDRSLASWPCP